MSRAADLLIVNARLISLDPVQPERIANALAVQGSRILAVGPYAELRDYVGSETVVLDAEGGVVTPAFHDAHLHLLTLARSSSAVDCAGCRSIAEIGAAIRARAALADTGTWIRAIGYDDAPGGATAPDSIRPGCGCP